MEKFPRRRKVYGKKTTTSSAAAAFFTRDVTPPSITSPIASESLARTALEDLTTAIVNVKLGCSDADKSRSELGPPAGVGKVQKGKKERYPARKFEVNTCRELDDLTTALDNVILKEAPLNQSRSESKKPRKTGPLSHSLEETKTRSTRNTESAQPKPSLREAWLEPLISAYEIDGQREMMIRKWKDILDPSWRLRKIAESSYAEVYKVSNEDGTSVLKVMALKPPTGPGSQRETAVTVESVVSEVLIMDMLAEIPGFLEFKAAHIIQGKPPRRIVEAYDAHAADCEEGSFFPKPAAYHKSQLWLALELGDAGTDIEHFEIRNVSQLWDIFLKTVFALANGETEFGFEHRDLHEGNVCVKQTSKPKLWDPDQLHKFGYSGLEVTLLDYTLSRAQENSDEVVYRDLESDPELFAESELLQHQMYRRMRVWAFFRSYGITHPLFDREETPSHGSWENFMPYTNVIWLYYLLETIMKTFKGGESLDDFMEETEELKARIHPERRTYDGGFESAAEVLNFCLEEGWMREEDLM